MRGRRDDAYDDVRYWDERYAMDLEPFDWYASYQSLRPLVRKYVRRTDRILDVGCGNSELAEYMYEDGFKTITGIDFSDVVVNQMRDKYAHAMPELTFARMDAREMTFPNESFDAAIDKGTMDSVLCSIGNTASRHHYAHLFLSEIHRTLKPNATFLMISHAGPDESDRLRLLESPQHRYEWIVEVTEVDIWQHPLGADTDLQYYAYICTKGDRMDPLRSVGEKKDEGGAFQ